MVVSDSHVCLRTLENSLVGRPFQLPDGNRRGIPVCIQRWHQIFANRVGVCDR